MDLEPLRTPHTDPASSRPLHAPAESRSVGCVTSFFHRSQARDDLPSTRRRLCRVLEPIECVTLSALAVLVDQLEGVTRQRSLAELLLRHVLHVAPEIPVQVDAAAVASCDGVQIPGIDDDARHLTGIDAPDVKHP